MGSAFFLERVLHCGIRVFCHKRVLTVSTFDVIFFLFSLWSSYLPLHLDFFFAVVVVLWSKLIWDLNSIMPQR